MARVLLFGGSFNPIHHGHLAIARAVAQQLEIPRVVLIPAASPPHKQGEVLPPGAQRLEMCRIAVAGDPLFEVSDWELRQSGPNYTLLTVEHFRSRLPAASELYWLIGMDSLRELHTWHRVGDLAACCTLVTAQRPGFPPADLAPLRALLAPGALERVRRHILETPQIGISATGIRARVARGASIRELVPEGVADFVREHGLYRSAGDAR